MKQADAANSPLATFAINWGGPGYPTYDCFASAAAVASPATDGAGTGTAATGAQGGSGGAPTGTGAEAAKSPSASPNEENLRVLRENHDRYKSEAEKFGKLGTFDQVQSAHKFYTQVHSEINTIGAKLGYTEQDIAEAVAADPFKTLSYLRAEAAQAAQGRGGARQPDLRDQIKQAVDAATKPLHEAHNQQLTDKANSLFETETSRLIADKFKGAEAMPPDLIEPFTEIVSEFFTYDDEGIKLLKGEGKTAGVQKAFNNALDFLNKVGTAYVKWENSRRGVTGATNTGTGAGGNGGGKVSLKDIIEGTPAAAKVIKSFQ